MKIESLWKFTFDPAGTPLVLLNYRRTETGVPIRGDYIEGEVRWPLANGVEIIPLVDSDAPFLRPTGNSVVTIAFDVYTVPTDGLDVTARTQVLDSLITIGATRRKPLRIEVAGYTAHYWQFAKCVITNHDPSRHLEAPVARLVKNYTLTCTGLSKVAVP